MSDWVAGAIGAEGFEKLAQRLTGSELQSLLLEVMRRRARARSVSQVVAQFGRDRFTCPSPVDQRLSIAIDGHLLTAAEGFEALELSPVAPLGTCSTMALTDQNRVLSALRSTEVVSDPTNVLALACAQRLRAARGAPAHFTTSQRVIRAQPVPNVPGYSQHFRIFVLASGGLETKDHGFTVDALALHARTLLAALDRLERHGFSFGARRVDVLATPERAALGDRIAARLAGSAPVARKTLAHDYYSGGLRYMLWVTAPDGDEVPLGDGGSFGWLAQILSNRRAVYVASGLGAQLVPLRFRRPEPDPRV
jgi:hypothetical protein